jgi:hypothetical protein
MANDNEDSKDEVQSEDENEETAYQRGIDEIEMQFISTTDRQSVEDRIAERL